MENTNEHYWERIRTVADWLVHFLRTFETLQEEIHPARLTEAQARLRQATGDLFPALSTELATVSPPPAEKGFHEQLSQVITLCAAAYETFLRGAGRQFAEAFLNSRQALCRGLYLLYPLRTQLPAVQEYWLLPEARSALARLETPVPEATTSVGFIHQERTDTHNAYSLYVPEYYTPQQAWPLIVCLHGGYGHGNEYIWTWLRPAKSKGYLLLAPQSLGPTWSVLNPPLDTRSILAMLENICTTYVVDRQRVYLTGLSDGGIFTYLLGLAQSHLFAGIAPIAGELHPMTDPLLRNKQGQDTPLFIIHGAKDFIFPVESVRSGQELLKKIGYNVTYHELPDWGHAYTYRINETLVLPWFESLGVAS
jgi:phospholipase/carboxylesterase